MGVMPVAQDETNATRIHGIYNEGTYKPSVGGNLGAEKVCLAVMCWKAAPANTGSWETVSVVMAQILRL